MVEKNCGGKVPQPGAFQPQDESASRNKRRLRSAKFWSFTTSLDFSRALELIWSLIAAADKYLASEQPWTLGSTDANNQRARDNSLDRCRSASCCDLRWRILSCRKAPRRSGRCWDSLPNVSSQELGTLRWGQLKPGTPLAKSQTLFSTH